MQKWLLGLAALTAMPFVWMWLKSKLPKVIAEAAMKEIRLALAGGGVEDPDVKELLHTMVFALVKFAEKKLPDEGLGEQRMQLVLNLLFKTPLIGPYLKDHEHDVREVIENCVKEMDADLKVIEANPDVPKA